MGNYIKDKSGKFLGSIGVGKKKVPTARVSKNLKEAQERDAYIGTLRERQREEDEHFDAMISKLRDATEADRAATLAADYDQGYYQHLMAIMDHGQDMSGNPCYCAMCNKETYASLSPLQQAAADRGKVVWKKQQEDAGRGLYPSSFD